LKFINRIVVLLLLAQLVSVTALHAHHFKGLPHYNYFDNYPQTPEEEFLGQSGQYEFSLVIYDFQGINKADAEMPDTVRLYLVAFNLLDDKIYKGRMTMEIRDGDKIVETKLFESAELENLYSMHRKLPEVGDFSVRLILHDEGDSECVIPFTLSSQKIHWGGWIAGSLIILFIVAAIGARKARVRLDRKDQVIRNVNQDSKLTN